jgi:hypothetical protein
VPARRRRKEKSQWKICTARTAVKISPRIKISGISRQPTSSGAAHAAAPGTIEQIPSRPAMPPCPDVRLAFHGSLAFITPLTDVAQVWISDHLAGEESLYWGPPSSSSLATWARSSPTWRMRAWSSRPNKAAPLPRQQLRGRAASGASSSTGEDSNAHPIGFRNTISLDPWLQQYRPENNLRGQVRAQILA